MLFQRVIERPKVYVRTIRDNEATIEEQFGSFLLRQAIPILRSIQ
jgi:hypothetical protein